MACPAKRKSGDVAIKIDLVPDHDDAGWHARLAALAGLEVRGLVRVHEAFVGSVRHRGDDDVPPTGTHRYVVMDHVPGLTLRGWIDEHPRASPRQRLRILRRIAATLNALHRGARGRDPITHGDVKPSNVIVGASGRPTLVDLGMLRPSGSGRANGLTAAYSSPELRNPDGRPGPQADTFSFAVTTLETLTGAAPALDPNGALDLASTMTQVRSAAALRFRPLLRRRLVRGLAVDPDRRPGSPLRLFDGHWIAAVVASTTLVVGIGAGAFGLERRGSPVPSTVTVAVPTPTQSNTPASSPLPPSPTTSPTKNPSKQPTPVLDAGSILAGDMDGATPTEKADTCRGIPGPVTAVPHSLKWGMPSASLGLLAKRDIQILSVKENIVPLDTLTRLERWFSVSCSAYPGPVNTGCRPIVPQTDFRTTARFDVDLDMGTLDDQSFSTAAPLGVVAGKPGDECPRFTFLTFELNACRGNYAFSVTLTYRYADNPNKVFVQTFEPVQVAGRLRDGNFETTLDRVGSHIFRGIDLSPERCKGDGVNVALPYTSRTHEIAELFVAGIHAVRLKGNLSMAAAIDEVVRRVNRGMNKASFYDSVRLTSLCEAAFSDYQRHVQQGGKRAWRDTCGKPDPTPPPPSPTASPSSTPRLSPQWRRALLIPWR